VTDVWLLTDPDILGVLRPTRSAR